MLDAFLPLVLFVLVATISPGGATTLATASGATFGWWRSFPLLSGISFGLASMAVAAALGLGGLILAVPALQLAMKLLGSLYLLWLAVQIARRGQPGKAAVTQKPSGFSAGVGLLWQNPKAWAMTLSAAASDAQHRRLGRIARPCIRRVVDGLARALVRGRGSAGAR
ncbi:LysE family translocator [Pseudomonas syringae group genomosp. 3]|uniref:Amino acid efflux protein n=1 Tax=Pseudomonas syringae pv. viburni TaxID=251703 RepID=A0A0Q0CUS1_9PSED|nr:LysE family transporter [Pseudomonas syringae group genomosp. 3]KPZ13032.1 Amino acid efflux protein [Pseudomonas syringae pv. viburni]